MCRHSCVVASRRDCSRDQFCGWNTPVRVALCPIQSQCFYLELWWWWWWLGWLGREVRADVGWIFIKLEKKIFSSSNSTFGCCICDLDWFHLHKYALFSPPCLRGACAFLIAVGGVHAMGVGHCFVFSISETSQVADVGSKDQPIEFSDDDQARFAVPPFTRCLFAFLEQHSHSHAHTYSFQTSTRLSFFFFVCFMRSFFLCLLFLLSCRELCALPCTAPNRPVRNI